MKHFSKKVTAIVLILTMHVVCAEAAETDETKSWKAEGNQGAVAAGGAAAADAAIDVLQRGGTAADGAVAALLVLSVTDSRNFCFGGEVPILFYDAKTAAVTVIAGQGVAPQLATCEYFQKHTEGKIPGSGHPATAAVPAAVDAYLTLLDRYGTMTFAELAQPALTILDRQQEGWQPDLAVTIRRLIAAEQTAPNDRRQGYQRVANCFYRGSVARQLDAWSRANEGLIRYDDLASHQTRVEPPVAIDYRGFTVCKCGPWTQGPYLLQTLRLLEGFDLQSAGRDRAEYIHLLAEAMKLALADRDTFYADPVKVDVPLDQLLSRKYADVRRPLIDLQRAALELRPGDPLSCQPRLHTSPRSYQIPVGPQHDTTTCLVADREGNVVAATPSGWGGVLAGQTGIHLGSRLRSFNTWTGHPNCIEPGKRPRITLTPTLVLREKKPVAAISVAGGDKQDQVTLQLLLDHIEFGRSAAEAVTAPRFVTNHLIGSFNQPGPRLGSLSLYEGAGEETIAGLRGRGHRISLVKPPLGHPVMLTIDPATGRISAAGDPAAKRHSRAY